MSAKHGREPWRVRSRGYTGCGLGPVSSRSNGCRGGGCLSLSRVHVASKLEANSGRLPPTIPEGTSGWRLGHACSGSCDAGSTRGRANAQSPRVQGHAQGARRRPVSAASVRGRALRRLGPPASSVDGGVVEAGTESLPRRTRVTDRTPLQRGGGSGTAADTARFFAGGAFRRLHRRHCAAPCCAATPRTHCKWRAAPRESRCVPREALGP